MREKNPEERLLKTWSEAQQKVLAGWLGLVQGTERPSPLTAWNETVKAWQTAVQETLDAQARWLQDWTGRVQVTSGSPTDLRKNLLHALRESGQAFIEAQTEPNIVAAWYSSARHEPFPLFPSLPLYAALRRITAW
jgi:hypothetical protein